MLAVSQVKNLFLQQQFSSTRVFWKTFIVPVRCYSVDREKLHKYKKKKHNQLLFHCFAIYYVS